MCKPENLNSHNKAFGLDENLARKAARRFFIPDRGSDQRSAGIGIKEPGTFPSEPFFNSGTGGRGELNSLKIRNGRELFF